jgi:chromate transport protein ChrA
MSHFLTFSRYVVAEGWVSPRDFLLGLAIIQAFPGPNFNCDSPASRSILKEAADASIVAVYLGSLAAASSPNLPSAAGAVIGDIAIFAPGLILHTGTMGLWETLRRRRWVKSCLRGVHAAAVGLIYTAVYRLWEIGFLDKDFQNGAPLGGDPWWVVVTATSFVGGMWFKLSAPVAILLGGVMGMIWYGVVKT